MANYVRNVYTKNYFKKSRYIYNFIHHNTMVAQFNKKINLN